MRCPVTSSSSMIGSGKGSFDTEDVYIAFMKKVSLKGLLQALPGRKPFKANPEMCRTREEMETLMSEPLSPGKQTPLLHCELARKLGRNLSVAKPCPCLEFSDLFC